MYEDEIRKQRVAILQGLQKTEKHVLKYQIQNDQLIAISHKDHIVKVVKAQELN
ncbi:MAG: hypothetical protein MJZ52_05230 [Bacteroidales bacterium]|nr:hypothetical protein [Bacteroidales bacterium]